MHCCCCVESGANRCEPACWSVREKAGCCAGKALTQSTKTHTSTPQSKQQQERVLREGAGQIRPTASCLRRPGLNHRKLLVLSQPGARRAALGTRNHPPQVSETKNCCGASVLAVFACPSVCLSDKLSCFYIRRPRCFILLLCRGFIFLFGDVVLVSFVHEFFCCCCCVRLVLRPLSTLLCDL